MEHLFSFICLLVLMLNFFLLVFLWNTFFLFAGFFVEHFFLLVFLWNTCFLSFKKILVLNVWLCSCFDYYFFGNRCHLAKSENFAKLHWSMKKHLNKDHN